MASERITVTVEVESYTLTGSVRVHNGDPKGNVRMLEDDIPDTESSWLASNKAIVESAIREAAQGVAEHRAREAADRGFETYDDEDYFDGGDFGNEIDIIWES